jgi:hypothetical protein
MRTAPVSPVRDPRGRRPARAKALVGPTPLLEVRLSHPQGGHPLSELLHRESAEAHLIACRLTDRPPRLLLRWLDVSVPPERRDHLLRSLRQQVPPEHLAVAPLGPSRLLLRVGETAPAICVATVRAGGICVSCPLLARTERDSWRVVLSRGDRIRAFLRGLPGRGPGTVAIARARPFHSAPTLTRRQDRGLRIAYDLGYFDYPRHGSLGDVAQALGVGRSATLELLRRATAKLAEGRYGEELRTRGAP